MKPAWGEMCAMISSPIYLALVFCVQILLVWARPWYFKVGEYSKEQILKGGRNHNFTERPPRYATGKTYMFFHGYHRGWNTSIYFTTEKVWFLKHPLPECNFTNAWNTKVATHSGERWENIKQLRRFTPPHNSPKTYVPYEYDTHGKVDYDAVEADSWAVRHDENLHNYLESDHGVYDSSLQNNSFYNDPKSEDFGTADYLTKIYTMRDPREEFGTLWDFPA